MTENTIENKGKFFAQYWGQKALIFPDNEPYFVQKVGVSYMNGFGVDNRCLYLKSLESVSAEDAIDIVSLHGAVRSESYGYITAHSKALKVIKFVSELKLVRHDAADLIRSKGYALRWMDLSVEQMVDYGWIILQP